MPCPDNGPCAWPALDLCCLDDDVLSGPCVGGAPVDPDLLASVTLAANEIMWAKTGRQFGTCTVTIRPCKRSDCVGDRYDQIWTSNWPAYGWVPVLVDGNWINAVCGCGNDCSCGQLCEADLPSPVCSVETVMVDGIELDPSAYRVDDFKRLVRIDGDCWPRCQNLAAPDTEEGTWSVTLTYGREVPELVLRGAAEIACELLKGCMGQPCKLPQRVTNVTRQGVSISMEQAQAFWKEGRTGFYLADLAISTYNPSGLKRSSSVFSPDAPKWRRAGT